MSPNQHLLTLAAATALLVSVPIPRAAAPLGAHSATASLPVDPGGENVSNALEAIRAEADIPGVVAMAVQGGEVVAWGAAGVRAAGSDEALLITDPIHLGSCAKAMTSTLAAILVEEGVLKWETTLAEALPEFAEKVDTGFRDVTLEAFVKHKAGIAERARPEIAILHEKLREMEGPPNEVRFRILELVLAKPPIASNEGTFDYSNFGYMAAGMMMEGVTVKPWEELMGEKLFRPWGLDSAGVGSPAGEGVAVGHTREGDAWKALPPGPGGVLPDAMGPAGLVHCNLADWAKFVAKHLAGARGEEGPLAPETFARLHQDDGSNAYAGGWGLGERSWSWGEGKTISHSGSDGTWLSYVVGLPEWDITVVIATNAAAGGANTALDEARDLMLEQLGLLE